jgi:site-specific recombinase XerD
MACYSGVMNDIISRYPFNNADVLAPPPDASTNTASRIYLYIEWLDDNRLRWTQPSLAAYRDHLLERLSPSTVKAYLSTIRAHYKRLLVDNHLRRAMFDAAPGDDLANKRAFVEEVYDHLRNAIDPANVPIRTTTKQDRSDAENLRLTPNQAMRLLMAPGTNSLKGLRDTVAIALMLTTGVRKFELCAIEIEHLRHRLDGQLALLVPHGKRDKQRLVPYGAFDWVLPLVEHWLTRTGIETGPILRGFYRGNKTIRKTALTPRAVRYLLAPYPIVIDGKMRTVEPHDLRRSYARLLYDAGMTPEVLQQNLGHESIETTMGYIGQADAEQRKPPPGILWFDTQTLLR